MQAIKLIVELLPIIIQLIKTIEEELPKSGIGSEKLSYIKVILTETYPTIENSWSAIETIINATVKLFNATGVFKK